MSRYGEIPDYVLDPKRGPVCVACGDVRRTGDWPYCEGRSGGHVPGSFGHSPFPEYVDEHILEGGKDWGPNGAGEYVMGTRITSRSERRRLMKENGIEFKGRRYGGPTSPMF